MTTKSPEQEAREYDYDTEIRAILDPIKSRMYAIEINHAEWLRENNLHLVMTGPGDDSYKQIESLIKQAEKVGYLRALEEEVEKAFRAGQNSIGWRDDEMSRIDMTWETYKKNLKSKAGGE